MEFVTTNPQSEILPTQPTIIDRDQLQIALHSANGNSHLARQMAGEMSEKVDPIVEVDEDHVIVLFVNQLGQHFLSIVLRTLLLASGRVRSYVGGPGHTLARRRKRNAGRRHGATSLHGDGLERPSLSEIGLLPFWFAVQSRALGLIFGVIHFRGSVYHASSFGSHLISMFYSN